MVLSISSSSESTESISSLACNEGGLTLPLLREHTLTTAGFLHQTQLNISDVVRLTYAHTHMYTYLVSGFSSVTLSSTLASSTLAGSCDGRGEIAAGSSGCRGGGDDRAGGSTEDKGVDEAGKGRGGDTRGGSKIIAVTSGGGCWSCVGAATGGGSSGKATSMLSESASLTIGSLVGGAMGGAGWDTNSSSCGWGRSLAGDAKILTWFAVTAKTVEGGGLF